MKTLMRNGRDRRSENPFLGHAKKERVSLFGTDQRITSGPAARRPHSKAEYMTAPERFADSQIPLAPRAPSAARQAVKSFYYLLTDPCQFRVSCRAQSWPTRRSSLLNQILTVIDGGIPGGNYYTDAARRPVAKPGGSCRGLPRTSHRRRRARSFGRGLKAAC